VLFPEGTWLVALSEGTSYPESGLYPDPLDTRRVADQSRRGPEGRPKAPVAPPRRGDSTGPPLPQRPPLRRAVPTGAYASVPCWWSAPRYLQHVERVYARHYLLLRPQLVAATGGGISRRAVLAVAAGHAAVADFHTGRGSRPLLGVTHGPAGLTVATGLGARTVSRARTFLRLAGLATEVQPGRHRTLTERIDSWERGDKARGWTAVYALHPTTTHPVDNFTDIVAGQTPDGTPPHSGSLLPLPLENHIVSTEKQHEHRGATRPATKRNYRRSRRRTAPDPRGLLLATRWRMHPDSPGWAQFKTPATWAALLALPARHGWTARDLNALLDNHARAGRHIFTNPRNPIGYLSWMLNNADLADRPCALDDARATEEAADAARRVAAQLAARTAAPAHRAAAREALHGPGRAHVQTVLDELVRRRAK